MEHLPEKLQQKYKQMFEQYGRAGIRFEKGKPRLLTLKELTSQWEREYYKDGKRVGYKKHQLKLGNL